MHLYLFRSLLDVNVGKDIIFISAIKSFKKRYKTCSKN